MVLIITGPPHSNTQQQRECACTAIPAEALQDSSEVLALSCPCSPLLSSSRRRCCTTVRRGWASDLLVVPAHVQSSSPHPLFPTALYSSATHIRSKSTSSSFSSPLRVKWLMTLIFLTTMLMEPTVYTFTSKKWK